MTDFLFYYVFGSIGIGLAIIAVLMPLWAAIHLTLLPKLDPILFRQPFFQPKELLNYQIFPLSLFRSLNYIYLIVCPKLAKKKRFKNFDEPLPIGRIMTMACRIHALLYLLILLIGAPILLLSVWGAFYL